MKVSITDGLNLGYNFFQASVAIRQKNNPELAVHFLKIQRWMLITDTILLMKDCGDLYERFKEETSDHIKYIKRGLAIGIPLLILSFAARMKPSLNLNELPSFTNLRIVWSTPVLHKLSQIILASRIAINLFTFLSFKKSKLNLINATLQSLTVYNISQLPWLAFSRTFANPDQMWPKNQISFQSLTLHSHFLPQEPLTKENLSKTIQSIHEYLNSYFVGSKYLGRVLTVKSRNGTVISRQISHVIQVIPRTLLGKSAPYIDQNAAFAIEGIKKQIIRVKLQTAT